MIQNSDDFLEHYGVKGMKWGVRNERDTGDSKGSVVKKISDRNVRINREISQTYKARANLNEIRISELNKEINQLPPTSVYKRANLRYEKTAREDQKRKDLKKATKIENSKLTPTQKKLLIGAGVAAVIIGYGVAKNNGYDVEGIKAAVRRGQSNLKYGDTFKTNNSFKGPLSVEEVKSSVLQGVNPQYRTQGGTMNCRRNTFAYELRRRGYDVQATTAPFGYGQNESGLVNALISGDKNFYSPQSMSAFAGLDPRGLGIRMRGSKNDLREYTAFTEKLIPKADAYKQMNNAVSEYFAIDKVSNDIIIKTGDSFDIRKLLAKHPNGARGEIVFDMGAFAHSMQWEIFDGVPHIFDAQKASHFETTPEGILKLMSKWGVPRRMDVTRLDNVDLDMEFLSRWVENVK